VNRLFVITFALVLPFFAVIPASEQKPRRQRNRPPSINSFTSSLTRIQICPFLPASAVIGKPEVNLVVNATDPDGDSLHYQYLTTDGTIAGKGNSVIWDLRDLPRGPHEVRVTVSDGKGGKVDAAITVTTVDADICDRPPPPCPVIKVSCPDELEKSRRFEFSAVIEAEAKGNTAPSFYWKLNAGRIVKGQNSREIEVTSTGANGFDKITATLEVGGFDPSCTGTIVSCSTKIIW
jgi:Big-like domain-containing protein